MKKALIFLKHEFLEMLPLTIFFFVVFHILAFIRMLMAKQYGITISSSTAATIGALIVGKSILIVDALPIYIIGSLRRGLFIMLHRESFSI